jgi:hypothetical protein
MKYSSALAFFALAVAFPGIAASAQSAPRTVYVLPMAGGLDQFLAMWLTREHVMQVVADPKIADVVLTDRLGEAFEQKMAEIHPKDDKKSDAAAHNTFRSGKERGTVFLVDAKSRVLWSDYEKVPDSVSNESMNREAERIAKKLQLSAK